MESGFSVAHCVQFSLHPSLKTSTFLQHQLAHVVLSYASFGHRLVYSLVGGLIGTYGTNFSLIKSFIYSLSPTEITDGEDLNGGKFGGGGGADGVE